MTENPPGSVPSTEQDHISNSAACDAVSYEPVRGADYDMEIRCTEDATVEVPLFDGRLHPRCKQHIPMMLRALARPL